MSRIVRYRQYWMATLKDRHYCEVCGDLAVNAEFLEAEKEDIHSIKWVCETHLCSSN
jgi:hypothetical protein